MAKEKVLGNLGLGIVSADYTGVATDTANTEVDNDARTIAVNVNKLKYPLIFNLEGDSTEYDGSKKVNISLTEIFAKIRQERDRAQSKENSLEENAANSIEITYDRHTGLIVLKLLNVFGEVLSESSIDLDTEKTIVSVALDYAEKKLVFVCSDESTMECDLSVMIDDIDARFSAVNQSVVTETERAESAEQAISANLMAEVTRATGREDGLAESISTEEQARIVAVSNEATERANADTALANDISAENERALGAESALNTKIEKEITDRESAITTEHNERLLSISEEANTRASSDNSLAQSISGLDLDIKALAASLGTAAGKDFGISAGNLPELDQNGKLVESILPALAITDVHEANSEAEMLALTAQKGDVCVRADLNKTFILAAAPATALANWKELRTPSSSVISVNGKVGVVSLSAADVGVELERSIGSEAITVGNYTLNILTMNTPQTIYSTKTFTADIDLANSDIKNVNWLGSDYATISSITFDELKNSDESFKINKDQANKLYIYTTGTFSDGTNELTLADISTHIANTQNPHGVTKEQLSLGNVDNTSDMNKPISTATQTALDSKVAKSATSNTLYGKSATGEEANIYYSSEYADKSWQAVIRDENSDILVKDTPSSENGATSKKYVDTAVQGISKTSIGLGNVDNTADIDKPVSSAMQTALDAKQAKISAANKLSADLIDDSNSSNKFITASLIADINSNTSARHTHTNANILNNITAAFTSEQATKLAGIEDSADANKIESISINGAAQTITNKNIDLPAYPTKSSLGLNNVDNTSDADKPISTATQTALNGKQATLTAGVGIDITQNVIKAVGLEYLTSNPSEPNTSGLKIVVLDQDIPASDKRDGYFYIITE